VAVKLKSDSNILAMFEYVKKYLAETNGESTDWEIAELGGRFPFRKRSEHTWRVLAWADRLINEGIYDVDIDKEAILIAAVFHDVGYGLSETGADHHEKSALVFNEYAEQNGIETDTRKLVDYLLRNHSNGATLHDAGTPLELVVLMEADKLDESGAMSILWDCMAEGSMNEQSYLKTFERIKEYSGAILGKNPMRTETAKKYWTIKQGLVREFVDQLELDLVLHYT